MNKKAIKSVLSKKHKELYESVEDSDIKSILKNDVIITGGAIVSLLTGEKVHDYDIYFTSRESCAKVAEYYAKQFSRDKGTPIDIIEEIKGEKDKFGDEYTEDRVKVFIKSSGVASEDGYTPDEEEDMQTNVTPESDTENIPETPKFKPVFFTSNAITLSGRIQLIIRFFGSPEKIHENYDFVHCTNYWVSKTGELVLRPEALESIVTKELKYVGSKYPLCSIIRTRKFIQRGWKINAGQYLKMAMQVNELNLKDVKVLEDQLIGVDSGYFQMLIHALEDKKKSDPNWEISNNYVAAIVDKIF